MILDLLLNSCQPSSFVFHDFCLTFSEKKEKLSYFEPFQSELVLSRQTCQRNHMLNYTSGNGLGTK